MILRTIIKTVLLKIKQVYEIKYMFHYKFLSQANNFLAYTYIIIKTIFKGNNKTLLFFENVTIKMKNFTYCIYTVFNSYWNIKKTTKNTGFIARLWHYIN